MSLLRCVEPRHVGFASQIDPQPGGDPDKVLYLYSSNVQPLYTQNVLNWLAAPTGSHHTLRYAETWVDDETRQPWQDNAIAGQLAVLHFSLQHREQYFEPVFVPVKLGIVQQAWKIGTFYFVKVKLVADIGPRLPPEVADLPAGRHEHPYAEPLQRYRQALINHGAPHPYSVSAGLGPDFPLGEPDGVLYEAGFDPAEALRRNGEFLSRMEPFAESRFVRLLAFFDAASGERLEMSDDERPIYHLQGGRTYRLEFFSFQPGGLFTPSVFEAVADDQVLTFIGYAGFEVASHYDQPEMLIRAVAPANAATVTTMLSIRPAGGTHGPRFDLPIEVKPGTVEKFHSLLSVGVVGLLGGATVAGTTLKLVLFIAAVLLAGYLQFQGRPSPWLLNSTSALKPPAPPGSAAGGGAGAGGASGGAVGGH
jgi:hypothetical protein